MSDRPTHGWCPSCNEDSAIDADGNCLWCGETTELKPTTRDRHAEYVAKHGRFHPRLSDNQVHAAHRFYMQGWSYRAIAERIWHKFGFPTLKACESGLYEAFRRASLPRRDRGLPSRKISDQVAERARELYGEGRSMAEVAEVLFGSTPHEKAVRLEEGLRREFRRRGWELRTTAESLKGKVCRTDERCKELNQRGKPCGGNVVKDSLCWQHHPDYAENKKAIAHMESMRGRREADGTTAFEDLYAPEREAVLA